MNDIAIGDVRPRIQHLGDAVQVEFPYPFPIFETSDLEVYLDSTLQSSGYSVAGAGLSDGGTVTFDSAPADGVVVTLRRFLTIQRTSDFQEGGAFRASVVNNELDFIVACQQQLDEELSRVLLLAPEDSDSDLILPSSVDRADRTLAFDASGDPIAGPTMTAIEDAQANATAASASAAAALASEDATALSESAAAASAALAQAAALGFRAVVAATGAVSPTIDDARTYYVADATSAAVSITLPEIGTNEGVFYVIQGANDTNGITVNRSGTDTINGGTSLTVLAGQVLWIIADDKSPEDNWIVVQINTLDIAAARTWTGPQRANAVSVSDGNLDMTAANDFIWTPVANDTLEFSNEAQFQRGLIRLDNSSGYTIALGAEVNADASAASELTKAGIYNISYWCYDGTNVDISYSRALV